MSAIHSVIAVKKTNKINLAHNNFSDFNNFTIYINNGIRSQDLGFYQGKYNGYSVRFEPIVILNTLFTLCYQLVIKINYWTT
jgi:hypothetical protein